MRIFARWQRRPAGPDYYRHPGPNFNTRNRKIFFSIFPKKMLAPSCAAGRLTRGFRGAGIAESGVSPYPGPSA